MPSAGTVVKIAVVSMVVILALGVYKYIGSIFTNQESMTLTLTDTMEKTLEVQTKGGHISLNLTGHMGDLYGLIGKTAAEAMEQTGLLNNSIDKLSILTKTDGIALRGLIKLLAEKEILPNITTDMSMEKLFKILVEKGEQK